MHTSTCYVNSDKEGFIKEIIYKYPDNPEETIKSILAMKKEDVQKREKDILGIIYMQILLVSLLFIIYFNSFYSKR